MLAESLAQPERGGSRSSVHFSARLLLAMLTQQSAASRATRDGRGWQHWWLVIAGGGTVSQSGAAQAASLHFSARLLPARAKQLSAARRATRRSRSAAPPTVPASGAGWPRHWEAPSDERGGSSRLASLRPLGCCRCGRRHGAVGRELIEGKIGSVAAAHFPSSLPFPFTPSHPSEN